MNKRYRLLKDAPAQKAGSTLTWNEEKGVYIYDHTEPQVIKGITVRECEKKQHVEGNTEWFQEIGKSIVTTFHDFGTLENGHYSYTYHVNEKIPKDKFTLIAKAIDNVLNEKE